MKKRGGGLQRDHDELTTTARTRGDHRVSRSQRWSDFVRTNDGCVEEMGRQSFVVKIRRRREESRGGFTRVHVCTIRRMKYIIFVVGAEAVSMEHNTPHSRSAAAHSFSLVPLLAKSERGEASNNALSYGFGPISIRSWQRRERCLITHGPSIKRRRKSLIATMAVAPRSPSPDVNTHG